MKKTKAKLMAIKTARYILLAIIFCVMFFLYHKNQQNPWWDKIPLGQWCVILFGIFLLLYGLFHKDKKTENEIKSHMNWLKGLNILIFLFFTPLAVFSQDKNVDSTIKETRHERSIVMESEKIDSHARMQKGEFAINNKFDAVGMIIVDFPVATNVDGRFFGVFNRISEGDSLHHYGEASFDLSYKHSPIHLSLSFANDKVGKEASNRYESVGLVVYPTDKKWFYDFTKIQILRFGVNYNFYGSSTKNRGHGVEYNVFIQPQPIHIFDGFSIFSELYFKQKSKKSFMDFEIGLRNKKVLKERLGLGFQLEAENWEHLRFGIMGRFNISDPNPRHNW